MRDPAPAFLLADIMVLKAFGCGDAGPSPAPAAGEPADGSTAPEEVAAEPPGCGMVGGVAATGAADAAGGVAAADDAPAAPAGVFEAVSAAPPPDLRARDCSATAAPLGRMPPGVPVLPPMACWTGERKMVSRIVVIACVPRAHRWRRSTNGAEREGTGKAPGSAWESNLHPCHPQALSWAPEQLLRGLRPAPLEASERPQRPTRRTATPCWLRCRTAGPPPPRHPCSWPRR